MEIFVRYWVDFIYIRAVSTKLADLSGGERARIAMLKLLLEENNVLLDEPTNHLDIQAKEALEDALQNMMVHW